MYHCNCLRRVLVDAAASQEWSCGLDAAMAAAVAVAPATSGARIRSVAAQLGVRQHVFGLSSPEIAAILAEAGLQVSLRSGSSWLSALWRNTGWRGVEHFCGNNPSVAAITAIRRLARMGADLCFDKSATWSDVVNALTSGTAAIVCVSAEAYYRISEQWNHYVVIVVRDDEIRVIDHLAVIGDRWYPEWRRYTSNARSYDWKTWRGDLLIVTSEKRSNRV